MLAPNPGTTPGSDGPNIPGLVPFAGYPGVQPFAPVIPPPPVLPGPNPPSVGIQPIAPNGDEHVPQVNIAQDASAPGSQSTAPYPERFQCVVNDPKSVLRDAIAGQDMFGTVTINLTTYSQSPNGLSTLGVGSGIETVSNISFPGVANSDQQLPASADQPAAVATKAGTTPTAFVYSASATFWIEWARVPGERPPIPLRHGRGSAALANRGTRAVLGTRDIPAALVLQARYPDVQQRTLAARCGGDDEAERRVASSQVCIPRSCGNRLL
jgi:hypothetical protein